MWVQPRSAVCVDIETKESQNIQKRLTPDFKIMLEINFFPTEFGSMGCWSEYELNGFTKSLTNKSKFMCCEFSMVLLK